MLLKPDHFSVVCSLWNLFAKTAVLDSLTSMQSICKQVISKTKKNPKPQHILWLNKEGIDRVF